jgi:3-mercaptopyruvate sulfurtransferase SseA
MLSTITKRYFSSKPKLLIETQELAKLLAQNNPALSILNATNGETREAHISKRIPSSVLFDFGSISDPKQPGFMMMPSEDHFVAKMKEMDIRSND